MVDYSVYTGNYLGSSIPAADFPRLEARAAEELLRYERLYRVVGTDDDKALAVCAMADALYYFETAANGGIASSASVGSVSSSFQAPAIDLSPRGQAWELYRCAMLYLEIYRGCGPC